MHELRQNPQQQTLYKLGQHTEALNCYERSLGNKSLMNALSGSFHIAISPADKAITIMLGSGLEPLIFLETCQDYQKPNGKRRKKNKSHNRGMSSTPCMILKFLKNSHK